MVLGTTPAALGAAALCNSYRTRQIERRHPPARRFVEVDGRAEAEDGAGMTREAAAMQDHYGELRRNRPPSTAGGSAHSAAVIG